LENKINNKLIKLIVLLQIINYKTLVNYDNLAKNINYKQNKKNN